MFDREFPEKLTHTLLVGAVSRETAHETKDYPCGFRERCTRYEWIESPAKGAGAGKFRLVYSTTNPKKGGRENAPKAGTYEDFLVLGLRESDGHVTAFGFRSYDRSLPDGLRFIVERAGELASTAAGRATLLAASKLAAPAVEYRLRAKNEPALDPGLVTAVAPFLTLAFQNSLKPSKESV